MKKAALTFALISTVMVATSFVTPEVSTNLSSSASNADAIIIGGGATNGGRQKADFTSAGNESDLNAKQLSSFATDRQSTRTYVKLD